MLKIRLRRTGARKKPSYRIVVAESTAPRDGKYVEIIGTYDPLTDPATIKLDGDRAKHWLSVGAQPTERVVKLMAREGLVEAPTYGTPATAKTDGAATAEVEPATAKTGGEATAEAAPAAAESKADSTTAAEATVSKAEVADSAEAADTAQTIEAPDTAKVDATAEAADTKPGDTPRRRRGSSAKAAATAEAADTADAAEATATGDEADAR